MIITICGQAGSGKSTAAKLLAKKLGYEHFSAGDFRRKMAEERGLSLAEFNKLGEKEAFTDKEVDDYQASLAKRDKLVVEGRTSFYFIPNSAKVFLTASLDERAKRVFRDRRQSEKHASVAETREALVAREASDQKRYKKYYNIDPFDPKNFDLVIDTTGLRPEQVVEKILRFIKK